MNAKLIFLSCLAVAYAGLADGASLTEPATVFYGQVTNQSGGNQIVHEGELVWTISGPGNTPTVLRAQLAPHDEGRYSYFIEVPHHVLAAGLTAPGGTVALTSQPAAYQHVAISLEGRTASIRVPGEDHFEIATAARAATYRLDLSVALPVTDSDGDGMPDWWEELQGLDPDSNDSALDPDGDGITNLNEFRGGTGPGTDNRGPELLTSRLLAYAGATTGVLLRTSDLDSAPGDLGYTLVSAPTSGSLRLRGAEEGAALGAGDTFTHADVEGGRLVFEHEMDAEQVATRFKLRVRDENPAHAASEGEIEITYFDPVGATVPSQWMTASAGGTALDGVAPARQRMVRDAVLGRELAYVVWDLTEATHDVMVTQPADAFPSTISGGAGKDTLTGGPLNDFLSGGANDDVLTGAAGADRFVLLGPGEGRDRITDFHPAEGDVIDVTAALAGSSQRLTDYVRLRTVTGGSELALDANGDGSGFTDYVVTLENYTLPAEPLHTLVGSGNLVAGTLVLPPLLSIAATDTVASETGPNPGEFTITRLGSTIDSLVVSLQIGGSATNGVDYSTLPGTVTIPAGASSVVVTVSPFVDSLTEVAEIVELRLLESSAYTIGSASVAQVVIDNLKPQIRVETLVPVASVSGGQKGIFLINRAGDVDAGVLLRFRLEGTARNGSDYESIPTFFSLAPRQTFALIEVTPRPGANLTGGAATVVLSVLADSSYERAEPTSAEIVIVPELLDLETWRSRHFAGSGGSIDAFAVTDSGDRGVVQLLRYGFGLNPSDPRATSGRLPSVAIEGGHLVLRYHEEQAAVDLDYIVEMSNDLKAWRPASATEVRRMPTVPATPLLRIYRSTAPASETDFRYLRVRVTRS